MDLCIKAEVSNLWPEGHPAIWPGRGLSIPIIQAPPMPAITLPSPLMIPHPLRMQLW